MTEIKKKTSREHILERPSMYIGASNLLDSEEYILKDNKVQKANIQYIPGLIKIINEVIDNSVDIAIKTNFKGSNLVDVKMTSDFVEVKDNGPGIPVSKQDNEYLPFICWGYSMSGSNFDNDSNRTQMGMNGLGAYCTNVWSKKFIGISDDGKNRYQVTFKDNAKTFKEQVSNTVSKGCTVKFYPDLERFGLTMIDETHKAIIFQRLLNLSISFPEITFKFNGKTIKTKNFKAYAEMFSETFEVFQGDKYSFAIMPSNTDEFQAFDFERRHDNRFAFQNAAKCFMGGRFTADRACRKFDVSDLVEFRGNGAGTKGADVYMTVALFQFFTDSAGQADNIIFRSVIGRHEGTGKKSGDRSDIQDISAVLRYKILEE